MFIFGAILFFIGLILLFIGIIWILFALFTKKPKKKSLYFILIGAIALFVGPTIIGSHNNNNRPKSNTHPNPSKIYKTKIELVKVDDANWDITGTTDAPNGTKIIAINSDDSLQLIRKSNTNDSTPTVKDGKFKGIISGIYATSDNNKPGDKIKVYIVGTNKKVLDGTDTIKSKFTSKILNSKFKTTLNFTKTQKNSIDADDESSSSSKDTSSSEASEKKELVTAYEKSMNKYIENKDWSGKLDFSYDQDANQAKFEIHDSTVMAESKESKRNLYIEFKEHSDKIADLCDLEEHPKLQIITTDGQVVAETKVLSDGVTIH